MSEILSVNDCRKKENIVENYLYYIPYTGNGGPEGNVARLEEC